MKYPLYDQVALGADFPEYRLKRGDVAVLVDFVPLLVDGEQGVILEVFNAVGESVAVVTVPVSAIKPLKSDEILTVRSLV